MYGMFRKVNAREKIVGWYHSGPNLNPNDININDVLKQHAPDSVLLVVDVQLAKSGRLPTDAYIEVEEVHSDGTPPTKTFEHVASEIGAEEAEEVGVEHLLRDIKDQTAGTLSQKITDKYLAVQNMHKNLALIANYLKKVSKGDLPPNHQLNYLLQDLLNLLPDILSPDFVKSTNVMLNDEMLQIYLATLARSVVSLHNLINNKISLREAEKLENDKTKDATTKKEELAVGADKKKNDDCSKEPLNPAKKN
uniref:MPN domain-containing protein n=1 Tax=Romanomermis culicivorax TaxID=13658 RepID=A0A915JRU7_ROMCU